LKFLQEFILIQHGKVERNEEKTEEILPTSNVSKDSE
jgi:hypothetical protein